MKTKQGLDAFRIPAALLVIAIHTSPLASFSRTADFLLTRVAARVAVPFFLMVTGFFLLPGITGPKAPEASASEASRRLFRQTGRLLFIYLLSILLYLPLNLYAGQLSRLTIPGLLRMIFFDGTFYHLWYLPAAAEGILLVYLLSRFFTFRGCLAICSLLYLTGLGGDSYWGLISRYALPSAFYQGIFSFCDYTRNGIFFAPLFLCLGWLLARRSLAAVFRSGRFRKIFSGGFFLFFLFLMAAEALFLRQAGWMRHDSMYLMLPPCMVFLFLWLLEYPEKAARRQRTQRPPSRSLSLILYIIHPWMIVLVRGAARFLGLEQFLVNQSLIHYLAVASGSCLLGVMIWKLQWILHHTKTASRKLI